MTSTLGAPLFRPGFLLWKPQTTGTRDLVLGIENLTAYFGKMTGQAGTPVPVLLQEPE